MDHKITINGLVKNIRHLVHGLPELAEVGLACSTEYDNLSGDNDNKQIIHRDNCFELYHNGMAILRLSDYKVEEIVEAYNNI